MTSRRLHGWSGAAPFRRPASAWSRPYSRSPERWASSSRGVRRVAFGSSGSHVATGSSSPSTRSSARRATTAAVAIFEVDARTNRSWGWTGSLRLTRPAHADQRTDPPRRTAICAPGGRRRTSASETACRRRTESPAGSRSSWTRSGGGGAGGATRQAPAVRRRSRPRPICVSSTGRLTARDPTRARAGEFRPGGASGARCGARRCSSVCGLA
jgi:hypothetical protein